ncbi:hypothetical protein JTB14_018183 [Gonioctena quinquepunctata]|nr:hypothetical protein JTB14_018183 [Gonioctena quinquepunctata]
MCDWTTYKELRHIVNVAVELEKKAYHQSKFVNTEYSKMWTTIISLNLTSNSKSDYIIPDKLVDVDELNNHFVNSIPKLTADQDAILYYQNNTHGNITSQLTFKPVEEIEISNIIKNLKSKAKGLDGLNISSIKLCISFVSPYLTHVINFSLQHSAFPAIWKKAKVIPLPKIPNPSSHNDIRPINISPTMSKIFEKIIEIQLCEHLLENKIIPANQSG